MNKNFPCALLSVRMRGTCPLILHLLLSAAAGGQFSVSVFNLDEEGGVCNTDAQTSLKKRA